MIGKAISLYRAGERGCSQAVFFAYPCSRATAASVAATSDSSASSSPTSLRRSRYSRIGIVSADRPQPAEVSAQCLRGYGSRLSRCDAAYLRIKRVAVAQVAGDPTGARTPDFTQDEVSLLACSCSSNLQKENAL
jgi:hypothetical protein